MSALKLAGYSMLIAFEYYSFLGSLLEGVLHY